MYKFTDVNEVSAGAYLPAEALMLNGEYIENLIDGYRTLSVTGREALSPELITYETGVRDGARLLNKRFSIRIITVKYQLIAKSNEAFREAYNKLGKILNVENAELIFNDEQDKFFKGTPSLIGAVDAGKNAVIGEIEFTCNDPFKYSVIEYEAEASTEEGSILIDYNGTYKAYPTLEAHFYKETDVAEDGETAGTLTGNGDCGYVAFFNENKKIIQLGDADEVDSVDAFEKSQTLINQLFTGQHAWGTTAKKLWALNSGIALPTPVTQTGDVTMKIASYGKAGTAKDTSGELIRVTSTAGTPNVNYTVKAAATQRTENSVKVTATITASLARDASWMGTGLVLTASLYIGGSWHKATLKKSSDVWEGRTGHSVNLTVNVTGLTAATTSITGIKFKAARTDSYGTSGNLAEQACNNLKISAYTQPTAETYYLAPLGYSTVSGVWHGPAITRDIGADAAGEVGAANFTLTYKQKMSIGDGKNATTELGAFQVQLTDANGKNVAGVRIHKNLSGKTASVIFYVNGVKVYGETVDLSYNNAYFGADEAAVMTSTIKKSGNRILFCIGGLALKVFTDDAIKDIAATKVTFAFEQYSNETPLANNGLYWAKFVKDNCDTYKDIPNKFSANEIVTANCRKGEICLNGIPAPELGALGNDWEGFYLTQGLNQFGIAYSKWVANEYAPTFKVRYREVFL